MLGLGVSLGKIFKGSFISNVQTQIRYLISKEHSSDRIQKQGRKIKLKDMEYCQLQYPSICRQTSPNTRGQGGERLYFIDIHKINQKWVKITASPLIAILINSIQH